MRRTASLAPTVLRAAFREFTPDVRRALRVDISATLLVTVFTCLTAPFQAVILRRELGATPFQLALVPTAGAVCLLCSLAWARLVEGRSPLPYVIWPGFVARALFLLVPLLRSAGGLVGVLVAGTVASAMSGPAQAAVVHGVYPREQRGRALGRVRMIAALPGIALVLGAGKLLAVVDYRWVFPVAGLIGMAAALCQRRLPYRAPGDGEGVPGRARLADACRAVRGDAAFRRLLVGSMLFGAGVWLQTPATPVLLADRLRVGTGQLGIFAAAAALAALVGHACWGRLADGRSSLHALRAVYAVGTLAPILYYAARSPWAAGAGAVTESLMQTGLDVVWMMAVIDVAGPRRITQYMAISGTLAGVRGVLGPLVGALLVDRFGVHAVYGVAATVMGLATLLLSRQLHAAPAARPLGDCEAARA